MNRILQILMLVFFSASQVQAASWKSQKPEDTNVDGGEILYVENESGNANNWMSLDTLKSYVLSDLATVEAHIVDFMGSPDTAAARAALEISSTGFAFDTFPEYEDSAHDSGIAVNATTLAVWNGTKWMTASLTDSLDPTPVVPTLTSRVIGTDGVTLTLTGSASLSVGAGGSGGFDVDCSTAGNGITATYSSGAPGSNLVYTLGTTVNSGDTCDLDYTQPGNGIEATTGGADLASITSAAVTNNSTQTGIASCIGYENDRTDCVEGAQANVSSVATDTAIVRKWTATEGGTALRLHQNTGGNNISNVTVTAVIYVNDQLRGTATLSPIANGWATSGDFTAYSGRSLSWSTSDVIAYGVSIDYTANVYDLGRDSTDVTTPNYYSTSGYLVDPFNDTSSSAYEMMSILEYE